METLKKMRVQKVGMPGSFVLFDKGMKAFALFAVLVCSQFAFAEVNLTNVGFNAKPGGNFEIKLDFDGVPPEPKGYNIEKPARIALDFMGVSSKLSQKKFTLSSENATSAVVLESAGRTRVIVNLLKLSPYETRVDGNSMYVTLGDSGAKDYLKPVTQNDFGIASTDKSVAAKGNIIEAMDFRRGEKGEGRLVINMSQAKSDINVFVEGDKINVVFKGVALPEKFQRRYDVLDFATPVQLVDAKSTQNGAVFSMKVAGEYDYLAYQAENEYVVSVKPLTKEEVDEREKEFAYVGEKLSLNFQDIEIRAVLQLIADFTGLNLVASDTVSGKITLRLQNVPWDQALELVLKTKGLDKRLVGNVLLVAPAAEIAERERREVENNKQIQELAPLQTEFVRIRYADAKELIKLFTGASKDDQSSMLSPRGSVIVDERTNTLLITETAQKLGEIRRVVKLLDIPIRQVLIEARIVIANANFDEQLGVEWGVASADVDGDNLTLFGADNGSVSESHNSFVDGDPVFPNNINVDLGVAGPTGQFAVGFIKDNNFSLALELSALETQGRGEIVSQPKVITGDKQEAVIKSGTEVPYQESSANGETTVSFKEAVLKLQVTPSITPDDRIIMDLVINQDSVGDFISGSFGSQIPQIDTTELTTQVLVGNGETVVLGGVFRTEDIESESKVPVLGDIPYLGRLFKRTVVSTTKAETLIFITPRILADTLVD